VRAGLLLPLLLVAACGDAPAAPGPPVPEIRVLLVAASARPAVRIAVDGAYRLRDLTTDAVLEDGRSLDRSVPLTESHLSSPLLLTTDGARISIDGVPYPGALLLLPGDRGTHLVVRVGIEDYVPGVLAGELGAAYPPAALRAQAVASRTYALDRARRAAPGSRFDVKDNTSSQVFRPPADELLVTAGRATRGLVLLWDSRPLPAYFHSTCGGHTAGSGEIFGGDTVPPLVGVPCPFCAGSRRHRWELSIPAGEAARRLGLAGELRAASIVRKGRGGRALTLRFETDTVNDIGAADARARIGDTFYSTLLTDLRVEEGRLVATGGGWGHGVGLCQIGATRMARAGASAGDILSYYYPAAELVRLF